MEGVWKELYDAAAAVRKERRISEYVTAGEVSAAILQSPGRYTPECASTPAQLLASVQSETPYSA